jgi:hypothetical protein
MTPHREMQLWVESANPDYQKAVEERLAELRELGAKGPPERRRGERLRIEREVLKELKAAGEEEELKKCRAKKRAREKYRAKKRENAEAFAVRLAVREDREQFKRDLFDGLLSVIPREKAEPVLRADPPKETGHLSDSEIWNGYEWERD